MKLDTDSLIPTKEPLAEEMALNQLDCFLGTNPSFWYVDHGFSSRQPADVIPIFPGGNIMALSMYQASIPFFVRSLNNLSKILEKAEAYADMKKIEPAVLVNARLAPDMFPLSRQIQIATDGVKGCAARLAGIEVPSYPDTETTFPELEARIQKTVAFLQSVKPEQIDGSEGRVVTLKIRNKEVHFKGMGYLFGFVIPNFYFHVTATYAILRHNGLEIGKMDYLGNPPD